MSAIRPGFESHGCVPAKSMIPEADLPAANDLSKIFVHPVNGIIPGQSSPRPPMENYERRSRKMKHHVRWDADTGYQAFQKKEALHSLIPVCMRRRHWLSPHQVERLTRRFEQGQTISKFEGQALALEIGLTDRQVATWFQNRRSKINRIEADLRNGLG